MAPRTTPDTPSAYDIPALGGIAHVEQLGDELRITGVCDVDRWIHYLALDEDYGSYLSRMHALGNLDMDRMLMKGDGIRVLNQDPFEMAITSIITQNNNIPRIKRCIERLCGGPREPFPDAISIASKLETDDCGLGYRRDYLRCFCADEGKWLDWLNQGEHSLDDDMGMLMGYCGIGPKVASCICLFGLGHKDAYPVDVWMKRAEKQYGIPVIPEIAGIQQQFIFSWMSNDHGA